MPTVIRCDPARRLAGAAVRASVRECLAQLNGWLRQWPSSGAMQLLPIVQPAIALRRTADLVPTTSRGSPCRFPDTRNWEGADFPASVKSRILRFPVPEKEPDFSLRGLLLSQAW